MILFYLIWNGNDNNLSLHENALNSFEELLLKMKNPSQSIKDEVVKCKDDFRKMQLNFESYYEFVYDFALASFPFWNSSISFWNSVKSPNDQG